MRLSRARLPPSIGALTSTGRWGERIGRGVSDSRRGRSDTGDGDRRHGHPRTLAERLGDVGLRLFEHAPLADGLPRRGGLRADPPTLAGRQRGGLAHSSLLLRWLTAATPGATHRQRSATVLLAWESDTLIADRWSFRFSSDAGAAPT